MQNLLEGPYYTRTSAYFLRYHFILTVKGRQKVLDGDVKLKLEEIIKSLANQLGLKLVELDIMPDYVHLLVDASPKNSISSILKGLKGVSGKMILKDFPELKQQLSGGHLWHPGYLAISDNPYCSKMIQDYLNSKKVR